MGSKNAHKQADSRVPFDVSRAPHGLRAATALVAELAKLDDRFERHYIEIKSDIDPSKNELAKIAKFILGAANRMPDVAATAFEGYGVMVIGVTPGQITGVPKIEMLDIDKVVSAYIGPNGPTWDLIHVPVEGSTYTVLVILVDPPQDGQDAFVCRKEGDNLFNGRIYVRADGETREARADEIDKLLERGKRAIHAEIGFEVEILGHAYPVEIDEAKTLEAHLDSTTRLLLDALPQPEPEPEPVQDVTPSSSEKTITIDTARYRAALGVSASSPFADSLKSSAALSAAMSEALKPQMSATSKMLEQTKEFRTSSMLGAFSNEEPETRTDEEYREAIERWTTKFRAAWPEAVSTLTAFALEPIAIRVRNKSKVFFNSVELKIHLEGSVEGYEWLDGTDGVRRKDLELPNPPRAWGPTKRSGIGIDLLGRPEMYAAAAGIPSMYRSPISWKNGGSVDITLDVGELRPRGEGLFDEDELILVLPLTEDPHVKGTWEITASGHDDVFTGDLRVEVGPPVDLTDFMRRVLRLPN